MATMEKETELVQHEEIIKLLTKIEKNTRPAPRWQKVLLFIFTHLLTIVGIIIIAYISWKIFGLLGAVSDKVTGMREALAGTVDSLKFWD